jgi:putative alpha-1,2-mannosidase
VPLFEKVELKFDENTTCTILKKNSGRKTSNITYDDLKINDYFISDKELKKGKELIITTR